MKLRITILKYRSARGIYAKYHYKSRYYLYNFRAKIKGVRISHPCYYAFLILLAAMLDHSYQLGLLVRGRNVLVVLRQIGAKITNSFPRY